MACSKYEYVKSFENDPALLPNTYVVCRLDGRGFTRLSHTCGFTKPNDAQALTVMNQAARSVMENVKDITIGFGQSDEYSFVFKRDSTLFNRRSQKILTTIVSHFTAAYVQAFSELYKECRGSALPTFDGRLVTYPSRQNVRDYLSWRQVDCHINNVYNTCFWGLVQRGGFNKREAYERLLGTSTGDKNELLFSVCGVNYNDEPEQFKKGTTVYRSRDGKGLTEATIDIIGEDFWNSNPHLL